MFNRFSFTLKQFGYAVSGQGDIDDNEYPGNTVMELNYYFYKISCITHVVLLSMTKTLPTKSPLTKNPNYQIKTKTPHSPFSIFFNYHNKL